MEAERFSRGSREEESKGLAKAFLEGERKAFDRLILMHQKMVFSLCFRLLGDYDEADDCAQEVFIRVYRYLKGFRFESSFRTWLYRVTVNVCRNRMDRLEYRMKKKKVRMHVSDGEDAAGEVNIPDRGESPPAGLARKETGRIIQAAIDALPGGQRMVVVLKDIEGRSYEEIVDITGLRMGTVKSRLSRARLKLREVLQGKIDHGMQES